MVLEIQTTGIEQYLPGGEANVKTMIIGGPGAGKTRWSSYAPAPIYANVEAGLSSVADRKVPYVDINTSADMLQFLRYLKNECEKPRSERKFKTVVIDTLDSFQRKVKDEWLLANPSAASFSGYDAWGYLDAKMQMLMTRLLNLDMNVIVLVHYKDKIVTEGKGEGKTETHQLMLQLQGDIKDSAFNDFDLVGWMGTFWKAGGEDEGRVEARGLTFKPTPDKPFLKDRLHVTPTWMEIEFSDSDWGRLFEAFLSRVDDLEPSEHVGTIEHQPDEAPISGDGVVGSLTGGPLPPVDPKDMPLDQLKKDELVRLGRSMESIKDEVKTSMLKAELVELIEKGRAAEAAKAKEAPAPAEPTEAELDAAENEAEHAVKPEAPDSKEGQRTVEEVKTDEQRLKEQLAKAQEKAAEAPGEAPESETPVQPGEVAETPNGEAVDTATGEILTPEQVAERLGGEVISKEEPADTKGTAEPAVEAEKPADEPECEVCGKALAGENPDYVKLAYIKFRKRLCNEHYQEAKKA